MRVQGSTALLQKVLRRSRVSWDCNVAARHAGQYYRALAEAHFLRPPRFQLLRASSFSSRLAAAGGGDYEATFRASVEEPEKLWAEAAQGIEWFKPWAKTMERRDPFSTSWFVGGELNICYNAVDRHVENGQGDQIAIIYDSPVTNTKETITYSELLDQVSKLAGVMASHGVKKGDCVIIYMPMIPQTIYTMLACARLGAIHSLIFGGFASKELSTRIDHARPKLVVTATFGIEPGRKVEYVPLLEKALEMITHQPERVLIYSRPNMGAVPLKQGRDVDWHEEMAKAKPCDCVPVLSDHPLYILYTSGTTGTPKGVVRPTGGYAVMLNWTMSAIYGLKTKEIWWAASDLGWVVGHSYICYGPLLHGNTTVLYEGKPVGTPDAGAFFRVLAEHGVAAFFTAPTAIRAIRQQDPEATLGKQYRLTRFRTLFVAGERCDVDTLEWCKKIFRVPVLDHWWQTVMILDDNNQPVEPKTLGNIVVKLPLPPGAFLGLWKNEDLYKDLYFQKFPGYYDTMDAGYMDEDGYLYVLSRVDDVINVAGHRISAGAIEEAVLSHSAVADCAVVGQEDSLKGHVPLALCVLREGVNSEDKQLLEEIIERVRENIGPVAAFRKAVFVKQIPKTRSGKIPRSALSSLVNSKPYKISPTIEDPTVFKHVEDVLKTKLK
ncbi:acyl-CoA synthetase short-chain family member 3, mitochondrial isoform X2 [Hemicordylus capensis]|uniref:acyl-CoA synthetase short-chain family member 3, mitochondrial isoform X2 n=1 Tax=Hemicordylus capensis TaxID=884348 RepID=UPI0023035918|nr:acyl-CoA synthetase short-chain family member 3, mitochondrial isoform X2 [Hemicordylus capensis]